MDYFYISNNEYSAFRGVKLPYCRKCGAELKEDAKFCSKCGTPVSEPARRKREHVDWWE
ncbi:zinc ribbon domain-containing protein [Candidatus Bathyarchaeota archaeon]|nr:MAG: zinc ribbon domain-containing protein [Candidatus Bathyarchaeota archaeon]